MILEDVFHLIFFKLVYLLGDHHLCCNSLHALIDVWVGRDVLNEYYLLAFNTLTCFHFYGFVNFWTVGASAHVMF